MAHGTAPKVAGKHGHHGGHYYVHHGHGDHVPPAPDAGPAKDPVCGMTVDPHTTKHRAEHGGHPFYFCSNGCRTKFEVEPDRYLDPDRAAAKDEPVPEGTIYTLSLIHI